MENADKDTEKASEASILPEKQTAKNGPSPQQAEEDPGVKANEEFKDTQSQSQEEKVEEGEKLITSQRIINLQRDLSTLVTNIQTSADAKESMRRRELEEARRLRLERLENDVKSTQEKFEEITRGWSVAQQKVIPQELQGALNHQQQLCAAVIEDKKKLINDLNQELKVLDDFYVKDLKKQAEELGLMMERMEDQIETLTKAYREELLQIERVYQQESEVLLTRDKTKWEQCLKEFLDTELERLDERRKEVNEYEAVIHNLWLEADDKERAKVMDDAAKTQAGLRGHEHTKASNLIVKMKKKEQGHKARTYDFSLVNMKRRIVSLDKEMKRLRAKYSNQEKQFTKMSRCLSEDYKRNVQRYEGVQRKIKHFAAADVIKFKEMWLVIEAEIMQLVERALTIDMIICKQHLGLAWERPRMPDMKLFGPMQPKKQEWSPLCLAATSESFQIEPVLQSGQKMMDASVGPQLDTDAESTDMEKHKEGMAGQSESTVEREEGKMPVETQKKVMELLCDEAGFLMEDKLPDLLAPLEKEEQTVVKLGSLLCSFGIEVEDVPKLALFLIKHKHQQRDQTEDVCVESSESSDKAEEMETNSATPVTSDLMDPNHVLPALKSFLEQLSRSRESSACKQSSFQQTEAWHTSEDEAYWEGLGDIISENKLKLWEKAEGELKEYQMVLTEISELQSETQTLEQQNTELRMLLQQTLNSKVSTELEMS